MAGAAAASSCMGFTSCVSVRSSSSTASPPASVPSHQKSSPQRKKKSFADQLQPLSTEFLEKPPPRRIWTSPTRKKARDCTPPPSSRPQPSSDGSSTISDTISLLTQPRTSKSIAPLLDSEISFLTSKDIVTILNSQTSLRRALFFFEWAKSKSFPMNSYVYNVILKLLRKAQKWATAKALVEEMMQNDIAPDNITYSTMISFAMRCGRPEEALDWFSKMQDASIQPDSVSYCAVIEALSKCGRMREAEALCFRMQQEINPLDVVAYSQIIKLHGMQNDFRQMWEVYNQMLAAKVVPNVVTYNSLISMLGNAGRSFQVSKIFNDMLGHGLKPSPVTLSLMFRTFTKSGDFQEAFKLYERMKNEEWTVDAVVYNSLLTLCAQLGKVEEGETICKEFLSSKVCRPDDWTWRTLVDMYVKGGKLEDARRISKEMVDRGRSMDLPVYMNLIQGYGRVKDFKAVVSMVDEIKEAKVPFDHMLAGGLLSVLVSCEEAEAEERELLLERIGLVYPKLKVVVENLTEESVSRDDAKEDIHAMLSGASEDCRRPFCNLLMDLCWVKQLPEQAHDLLAMAISFGLYSDLQERTPVEWSLKLRTLSFGAARTALQGWLSSLRAAIQAKEQGLPFLFNIEVGLGTRYNHGTSDPVLSTFISALLAEMKAPFEDSKPGWLTANASDVKKWLLSSPNTTDLAGSLSP